MYTAGVLFTSGNFALVSYQFSGAEVQSRAEISISVVTVVIQAAMVHDAREASAGLRRGLVDTLPQRL